MTRWERVIDAEPNEKDQRGLEPDRDCFACAHLSAVSGACFLLAKTPRLAVILDVTDYRASGAADDVCRQFKLASPQQLGVRRSLWGKE